MIHDTPMQQERPLRSAAGDGPIALIKAVVAAVRQTLVPLTIWVVACLIVAYLYARSLPPVYSAAATLILEAPPQFRGIQGEVVGNLNLDLNRVDSELQLIRSERLQRLVFDSLGMARNADLAVAASNPEPPVDAGSATPPIAQSDEDRLREIAFGRFQSRFDARRLGQSYVLEISYSSADPVLAARVANAAASAYLLQSVAFKAAAASGGGEFVQGRLDALSAQVDAADAAVRNGTLPEIQITDAGARIIGAATVPLSPSAPRVKLIAALGGVLGLMSGFFVMALGFALYPKVGDGTRLARESDLAVLGLLPRMKNAGAPPAAVNARYVRALRDLRTATGLAFGPDAQNRNRCIALASWSPGAGCSTLSMHLAYLMSKPDRSVVVIDADVRGGPRNLTARSRSAPVEGQLLDLRPVDVDGVRVLTASALAPFADSLADARELRVAEIFRQARTWGDVVIDLPPLSESADARALVRHADAVILIATPGTHIDEVALAEHQLRSVGANVIGIAINDAARAGLFSQARRARPENAAPAVFSTSRTAPQDVPR